MQKINRTVKYVSRNKCVCTLLPRQGVRQLADGVLNGIFCNRNCDFFSLNSLVRSWLTRSQHWCSCHDVEQAISLYPNLFQWHIYTSPNLNEYRTTWPQICKGHAQMHFLEIIGSGYKLMPIRHPSFHGYLQFSSPRTVECAVIITPAFHKSTQNKFLATHSVYYWHPEIQP